MKKKLLNITLALMMTLTLFPSYGFGTSAQTEVDDGVTLRKEATRVEGHLNKWRINLAVDFTPEPSKKDIVLIIDKSGSMRADVPNTNMNRMEAAKKAAESFVDIILKDADNEDKNTNRVAIVEYSSGSKISQEFTNDARTLKKTINAIEHEGSTFTQAALKQTRDYLVKTKQPDREQIVVVLTDGAATLGFGLSDTGNSKLKSNQLRKMTKKDVDGTGKYPKLPIASKGKNWEGLPITHPTQFLKGPYVGGENMTLRKSTVGLGGTTSWYIPKDNIVKNFNEKDFSYGEINKMGGTGTAAPLILYKYVKGNKTITKDISKVIMEMPFSDRKDSDYYFFDLLESMVAESKILKQKTGADIYTVALGLGDEDPLAEKAVKEMADEGKFFSDNGDKLSEYFDEIANSIQFPLDNLGLKTFDPMGESVDILEDSLQHLIGQQGGLSISDNTINWDMSKKSFKYDEERHVYTAEISYEVVLNEKAIAMLEKDPNLEIDTNGDAYFEYEKDGKPNKQYFNKPKVNPTVLKVSKELLDETGKKVSLEDESFQRAYHYDLDLNKEGLKQNSLSFNKESDHHIFQTTDEVFIKETHVAFDDIDKYDITYFKDTKEGLVALEKDASGKTGFKLEAGSGLNHIVIQNKLKSDYQFTDFEIEKLVEDENKNQIAEIGETLSYTINVKNNTDKFIRTIHIQDQLEDLIDYIEAHDDNTLRVMRNGKEEDSNWTVKNLKQGLNTHLGASETLSLKFDVQVIESKSLPDTLINTVKVDDKKDSTKIPVILPSYESTKSVSDANGNHFAESGERLDYSITVKNTGEVVVPRVSVADKLEQMSAYIQEDKLKTELVTYQNKTMPLETFIKEGLVLENIAVGTSETVSFSVYLKEDLDTDKIKKIENIASVGEETPKTEIETAKPEITSHKTVKIDDDKAYVEAGDTLNYELKIINSGKVAKEKVFIQDSLENFNDLLDEDFQATQMVNITSEDNKVDERVSFEDLKKGFEFKVDANQTLTLRFSLKLKDNLNELLEDKHVLENIARVDEDKPGVKVPFAKPRISSEKRIHEEFEDGIIEANEKIAYSIIARNTGSAIKKDLFIQDDLTQIKKIMDQNTAFESMTFTLEKGNQFEVLPLQKLHEGFTIDLAQDEKVTIHFEFKVRDDLDLEANQEIENIAIVGEDTPGVKTPTGKAKIIASKSVSDENKNHIAEANERLDYTISIENTGTVTKRDLFIQDKLENLLPWIQEDSFKVMVNDKEIDNKTLQKGFTQDVKAKEVIEIKFSVTLLENLDTEAVTKIVNLATVGEETPKVTIPTGAPKIISKKNVVDDNKNGFAEAGELLHYTLEIENIGSVAQKDLFIKDDLKHMIDVLDLSDELEFSFNETKRPLKELQEGFSVDIAAQEKISISFSVKVKDSFNADHHTELLNIAQVGHHTPGTKIPSGKPKILIEKSVQDENKDGYVEEKERLDYTIVVKNVGEVKKDTVLIKDELTQIKDYIVDFDTAQFSMNGQDYPLQDLVAGITVPLEASETLTLTFSVVLDQFDADKITSMENTASADDKTATSKIPTGKSVILADKKVSDENSDGHAQAGELLSYEIEIKNVGSVSKKDLFVKDDLKALADYLEINESSHFTINGEKQPLSRLQEGFNVDVDANETLSIRFDLRVKESFDAKDIKFLENIAEVGPEKPSVKIPSGYSEIIAQKFVKDDNGNGFAEANEYLHYHIKIQNIGNVTKEKVLIQDDLKDLLVHLEDISDVMMHVNDKKEPLTSLVKGFKQDIKPDEVLDIKFSVKLKSTFDADLFKNVANLATVDNETPKVEVPSGKPDIVAHKFVQDANNNMHVEKGEAITYIIKIHNNGKVAKHDLFVQDKLEDILEHVQDTSDTSFTYQGKKEPLAKLIAGFELSIDAGETVELEFTLIAKDDLDVDQVKEFANLATVGENTPNITIPTGKPKIHAKKEVIDENGDDYAEAGETLTYILTIYNSGNVRADEVFVQDDLAQVIPHVNDLSQSTMSVNGKEESLDKLIKGFNIAVEPDESIEIKFDVKVKDDFDADKHESIINKATVQGKTPEETPEETPEVKVPTGKPRIDAQKYVVDENKNGYAEKGERLDYTLVIRNTGEVDKHDLFVQDSLADLLDHVRSIENSTMLVNGQKQALTGLVNGFNLDIASGETIKVEFSLTLKDDFDVDAMKHLENIATVGEETPKVTIPSGKPRITASKKVLDENKDGFAQAGERLDYFITIMNHGEVKEDKLFIQDDLSDLLPFIDDISTAQVKVKDQTYPLEKLVTGFEIEIDAKETIVVSFSVNVKKDFEADEKSVFNNIATVGPEKPEITIPSGKPIITALKSVSDENGNGFAEANETLSYTITIKNTGQVKKEKLFVQDKLENLLPHVKDISNTVVRNGEKTYPLESLIEGLYLDIDAHSVVTLSFDLVIKDDFDADLIEDFENLAVVGEETPKVTIPSGKPNIKAIKDVVDENKDGYAQAGERLDYSLTIRNTGEVKQSDLFIQDDLKDLLPHIEKISNSNLTINDEKRPLKDLLKGFEIDVDAGEVIVIKFSVTLKENFDADLVNDLVNIATVGEETPKVTIPSGKPDITAYKTVVDENENGFAEHGERLDYTITIKNQGEVAEQNLFVKDDLAKLMPHIEDIRKTEMLVNDKTYPLEKLVEGFELSIQPNETIEIKFSVVIKDDVDFDEVNAISNIATVGDETPRVDIETGKPLIIANKSVSDENGDGFVEKGEKLSYRIEIENVGPVLAQDVLIQDDLSELLDHVQDIKDVSFKLNDEVFDLQRLIDGFTKDIDTNEKLVITFDLVVSDDFDAEAVKELVNIATVDDEKPSVKIPSGAPDIVAFKSVVDENGNGYAEQGEVLTYTLDIENRGSVMKQGLFVQDDLKDLNAHIESIEAAVLLMNGQARPLEDLVNGFEIDVAANSKVQIVFDVKLKDDFDTDAHKTISNLAVVGEEKPKVEIPSGKPEILISKTVSDENKDSYAQAGERLDYVISVENSGDVAKKQILVQDRLEKLLPFIEDPSDNLVRFKDETTSVKALQEGIYVDLDANEKISFEFSVWIKADFDAKKQTELINTAVVDDQSTSVKIPTAAPKISITKEVYDENHDGYASPNETLTYFIKVKNEGLVESGNVLIKDDLKDLKASLKSTRKVVATVNGEKMPLSKLQKGFYVNLKPQESLLISFSVETKDSLSVDALSNTAYAGPHFDEAIIPVLPVNQFKPELPNKEPGLPFTGKSNSFLAYSLLSVVIGGVFVLLGKKDEEN